MLRNLLAFALCFVGALAGADTLYVTEFPGPPAVSVYYQAVNTPALANQVVTVSGVSAQSSAFTATTKIIRVHADVACHVVVGGASPTATTNSMKVGANQTEYFVVTPGQRVAVIAAAAP
jgi:hypothetical protein